MQSKNFVSNNIDTRLKVTWNRDSPGVVIFEQFIDSVLTYLNQQMEVKLHYCARDDYQSSDHIKPRRI
jgi:hypothetical protein